MTTTPPQPEMTTAKKIGQLILRISRRPQRLLALVQAMAGFLLIVGFDISGFDFEKVVGGLLLLLGAMTAFIEEYFTTPVVDPNLPIGTLVNENSHVATGIVVDVTDPRLQP